MAQKYVGIDLGTHRVKVAVLTAGFRGAQLVDTFEEPVNAVVAGEGGKPEDADPYLPALQAALGAMRSRGLLGEAVGVALPPSMLSYRLLTFPFVDERRIAQAIGFEAEGEFPVPFEQLAHGHFAVPTGQGGGRALVVATRRDRIDQLATIFKRSGSDLKSVTSGATSLAQVLEPDLAPPSPQQVEQGLQPVTLAVDIGHATTQLVAIGAKGPIAVRTLRRGGRQITAAIARAYNLGLPDAEVAKVRDAFVPHRGQGELSDEQLRSGKLVAETIEAIVREIEHTRLWLRSTYRCEVVRLATCGGGAHLGGLAGYLQEQTGLPVELPRLKASLAVRGTTGRDLATYAVAIGTAYGASRRPLVQLHDVHAGQGDGGWVQERIGSLVAIGVSVLAFGALDTIARVKAYEAERLAYESELAETTKKVFGTEVAANAVDAKLDEAESQDLTSLIPQRGALEVLGMLANAATPSDLGKVPMAGGAAAEGGEIEEGGEGDEGGLGMPSPDEPVVEPAKPAIAETVDPSRGIVVSDEMVFQNVDIRERKIEMKIEATRASAQDRLIAKLKDIGCIANIERGKVRGEDRKLFEMSMDNNCYTQSSTVAEPAAEEPEGEGA
jgi:Tfp pilus assembly PilM family ATPase